MSNYTSWVKSIPVSQMIVDRTVQRALDSNRAETMAANYNPDALGIITLSQRIDGTLHVIDGQHRIVATQKAGHGDEILLCKVYGGLSRADEALLFRFLNETKRVGIIDRFLVRIVEGDKVAVELQEVLTASGWKVSASKNDGMFAAVSSLEKVYHYTGKDGKPVGTETCRTVIELLTKAWGHLADGVRGELVAAVGSLLVRYGDELDTAKLVSELGQQEGGPLGIIGQARSLRAYRGGRLIDAVAEIMVEKVNKGRRTRRIPPWRSE